jgi:transcription elongation factor GreA
VSNTTGTWLTQDAYDRLQQEYTFLTGEGRVAIANEIDERRQEGDLKENGGYHAAREEQGKQEARIARLREILRDATVGQAPADDGIVEPGMIVVAEVAGREMRFLVGSRESAEGPDLDVFSTQSPLGAALLGKKIGDETTYTAPNGKDIAVKVLAAEPFAS